MIKYFESYIAVIILVKNIYLKKDLVSVIIFHRQRICPCTVSKIIGRVIRVPFPITAMIRACDPEISGEFRFFTSVCLHLDGAGRWFCRFQHVWLTVVGYLTFKR